MPDAYRDASEKVCGSCNDDDLGEAHNAGVENTNHLKAWRKFRRMTLEAVANEIGTTKAVIQQLESGRMGLSHKWLLKLAPVFRTTPGFLLDHDPNDIDTAYLDAWSDIPPDDRPRALQVLKAFRTGTDG